MLTGEPMPVEKAAGDDVIGATINTTGTFVMRATHVGRDTALARIVELVRRAQGIKAPIQRLADRVSERFVPFVLAAGALTFVIWLVAGPEPRLTVRPHRVHQRRSSSPARARWGSPRRRRSWSARGEGAEAGILIRGGEALETAHRVAVVLRQDRHAHAGRPSVDLDRSRAGLRRPRRLLDPAASLERGSEHPAGAAIVRRADEAGLGRGEVTGFAAIGGLGVAGRVAIADRPDADRGPGREPAPHDRPRHSSRAAGRGAAGPRQRRPRSWPSRGRSRASSAWPTPIKADAADAVAELGAAGIEVVAHQRRRAAHRGGRRAARSASRRGHVRAEVLPGDKAPSSSASRLAAGSWRWSATASTTPRRSPRPTSASPSARARTSRSRRRTSRSSAVIRVGRRSDRPVARDDAGHPAEPRLGLRLQRRPHPGRDGRPLPGVRDHSSTRPWPPARWLCPRSPSSPTRCASAASVRAAVHSRRWPSPRRPNRASRADPVTCRGTSRTVIVVEVRFADTDAHGPRQQRELPDLHRDRPGRYYERVVGRPLPLGVHGAEEGMILADIRVAYRSPAFFGETLTVETRIDRIGTTSLTQIHRMTAPESRYAPARLVAVAEAVLVSYDYAAERPIPVPRDGAGHRDVRGPARRGVIPQAVSAASPLVAVDSRSTIRPSASRPRAYRIAAPSHRWSPHGARLGFAPLSGGGASPDDVLPEVARAHGSGTSCPHTRVLDRRPICRHPRRPRGTARPGARSA